MPQRHDTHKDAKRREIAYQRWQTEILREASRPDSLERVAARAMADPDVRLDGELAGMLREVVEGCKAELRRVLSAAAPAPTYTAKVTTIPAAPAALTPMAHDQLCKELAQWDQEFNDHCVHLHVHDAHVVYARLRNICEHYPTVLSADALAEYTAALRRLNDRRKCFEQHINERIRRTEEAAAKGNEAAASASLRHLAAIHASHPQLLPDARFEQVRSRLINASTHREHQEAARRLVDRERAVAAEIKALAAHVHRFHLTARRIPHNAEEYAQAEAEYHKAVGELDVHDTEWLAGLVLEMTDLLAEWGEPPESARQQVNRFIDSVNRALDQIRGEVQDIDSENGGPA